MTKKNRVGRPQRYEGEKNVQLSVTIRPRYRQALEIIAKDRNSTLSEAIELAISKLAQETILQQDVYLENAPSIMDYVRSKYEPLERIKFAYLPRHFLFEYFDNAETGNTYNEIMSELENTPGPLLSPYEIHLGEVIYELKEIINPFSSIYLTEAIQEDWKEGIPTEVTQLNIKIVFDFYNEIYIKSFWEKNKKPSPTANNEEIIKFIESCIDPFPDTEALLKALYEYREQKVLELHNSVKNLIDEGY